MLVMLVGTGLYLNIGLKFIHFAIGSELINAYGKVAQINPVMVKYLLGML